MFPDFAWTGVAFPDPSLRSMLNVSSSPDAEAIVLAAALSQRSCKRVESMFEPYANELKVVMVGNFYHAAHCCVGYPNRCQCRTRKFMRNSLKEMVELLCFAKATRRSARGAAGACDIKLERLANNIGRLEWADRVSSLEG